MPKPPQTARIPPQARPPLACLPHLLPPPTSTRAAPSPLGMPGAASPPESPPAPGSYPLPAAYHPLGVSDSQILPLGLASASAPHPVVPSPPQGLLAEHSRERPTQDSAVHGGSALCLAAHWPQRRRAPSAQHSHPGGLSNTLDCPPPKPLPWLLNTTGRSSRSPAGRPGC